LGMPPEEQDKLSEWIMTHVWLSKKFGDGNYKVKVSSTRPKGWYKVPPSKTGAFICLAPGKLAGKYANGDTIRTTKLFRFFWDKVIVGSGMWDSYEREIKLMPILLQSERTGIKINADRLHEDTVTWEGYIQESDEWIRRRLKAKELNVNSGEELADAIEAAGKVDEWVLTENGNRSTSKDNLVIACTDTDLVHVLNYRSTIVTSVRNFARSWLHMADLNKGFISTNWNQVRQSKGAGGGVASKGARTGRLSSSPNFQNVPTKPPQVVTTLREMKRLLDLEIKASLIPKSLFDKVGPLPYMRNYITPDKRGDILLNRDYSQQELRILGHFEDGVLMKAYNKDPNMDLHQLATDLINEMLGTDFSRKPIKNMGFGLIYGMGLGLLAETMGVDVDTARIIKNAYLRIFPGLKDLDNDLKHRGRMKEPVRTWGGREYYVEPTRMIKGKPRSFEYKLLNILIQGSAADCTKEAIIRYDEIREEGRLLLTVHDELMINAPTKAARREMKLLKEAMESVEFDVPMLSDGKKGTKSWGEMKKCA